jgi:Domain of unknown function (DUF427)
MGCEPFQLQLHHLQELTVKALDVRNDFEVWIIHIQPPSRHAVPERLAGALPTRVVVDSINAVWTYEEPYAAVAAIKDHLTFYPDRVDAIEERPGA